MNKKYFDSNHIETKEMNDIPDFQKKREFQAEKIDITPDTELENAVVEQQLEQVITPKKRSLWQKMAGVTSVLFGVAVIAQSVQWVIDSWQQKQWIYLAFSCVALLIVVLGISAVVKELYRLRKLKRLMYLKQQAQDIHALDSISVNSINGEQAQLLLNEIASNMQLKKSEHLQLWQKQVNEHHSAQEVTQLFEEYVLRDIDQQAQQLISKSAAESAIVVAISPLAIVDLFFVAWRNIVLINKIAALYRIELGYWSRLRLFKLVLMNMAFAGATELIHEMGTEWLSKDIMAKFSGRIAQGLGVGLLTARLGLKTIEFCRPIPFIHQEKPRLNMIHRHLLGVLKNTFIQKRTSVELEKTSVG